MTYTELCKIRIIPETIVEKNISDAEYFSDAYKEYSSNSKLKLINPSEGGNPELYFSESPAEFSKSLQFGSAVHSLILQPESYTLSNYPYKPSGKLGEFITKVVMNRKNKMTANEAIFKASEEANYYYGKLSQRILKRALQDGYKYYKDLYLGEIGVDDSFIILDLKTANMVSECVSAFKGTPCDKALHKTNIFNTQEQKNEYAVFTDFEVIMHDGMSVIIPFKLKIDNYSIDNELGILTLNDLKTTSKPVEYFMGDKKLNLITNEYESHLGSFQKYHYYRQIAVYLYVLANLHAQKLIYNANILAIQSKPPYSSMVFPISNAYVQKGLREFKDLLCRVAFYTRFGIHTDKHYERI